MSNLHTNYVELCYYTIVLISVDCSIFTKVIFIIFVHGITKINTLIFCSQFPKSTLILVFLLQPCTHTFDSATETFTALKSVFRADTFLYFSKSICPSNHVLSCTSFLAQSQVRAQTFKEKYLCL